MAETEKKPLWKTNWIDVPRPWYAVHIALPSVPLESSLRPELREKLSLVMAALRKDSNLQLSTWLLLDTLHENNEVRKIAANGRRWIPDVGLGVWPDREPPRMWSDADLKDRDFNTPLRPLMHTVIHISAAEEAAVHAWETMLGTGGTIQLLLEKSAEDFHDELRETLLPTIEDETYRGFSIYFPLLSVKSVLRRQAEELDRWLGPTTVYLRESADDTGVLLVTRTDPYESLRAAQFDLLPYPG
jgi:hypothetical protein